MFLRNINFFIVNNQMIRKPELDNLEFSIQCITKPKEV